MHWQTKPASWFPKMTTRISPSFPFASYYAGDFVLAILESFGVSPEELQPLGRCNRERL